MRSQIQKLLCVALIQATYCWAVGVPDVRAQELGLRYQGTPGQQFAYEIEITVDLPTKLTTFKGITRYTVNTATAEQLNLTYRGGLMESTKGKAASGGGPPRGPFGPGFRGPPGLGPGGFPDPFSRPTFAGKTQTTNGITLTPLGGVLAMEGDSQLPYLLGNVSILPFEVLPAGNERQWKYDSGISIEQKAENHGRPFGRFGPFAQNDDKKTQAGQENADYSIQSQDENKIVVKKSYRLKTPAVAGEPEFELTGSGTWTFNRKEHLPDAMSFQQKLLISADNTQTTVPITIAFHRLTAEAMAKLDLEAQQRQKELQEKMAADKQKAEAPLTAEEKRSSLAAIASGDSAKIDATLKILRSKTPKEPDSEMTAAIEKLLRHPNQKIREDAKATLLNWSPDFAKKQKLNEAYTSHMPVESTDREVNSTTPLYVGQILQFQENGPFWYAGEILELKSDGKVSVRDRGFTKREHTLPRRNLQLAPDDVDQPSKPAGAVATTPPAGTRTWSDATGEHKIEAAYLGVADGKVKLKKADGKEIAVPLDKLSTADQQFVQKQQATKKTPNPFE